MKKSMQNDINDTLQEIKELIIKRNDLLDFLNSLSLIENKDSFTLVTEDNNELLELDYLLYKPYSKNLKVDFFNGIKNAINKEADSIYMQIKDLTHKLFRTSYIVDITEDIK